MPLSSNVNAVTRARTWAAPFQTLARSKRRSWRVGSYVEQLHRLTLKPPDEAKLARAEAHIDRAKGFWDGPTNTAARAELRVAALQLHRTAQFDTLRQALTDLANS